MRLDGTYRIRALRLSFAGPLLAILMAAAPFSARGADDRSAPSPAELERITTFFNKEVAAGELPGAIVLIRQHGKSVYEKYFGVRDVATKLPMTADTLFALHSMTKPITSVAAMMLVDEGKLALADPVSKYIPAFAGVMVGIDSADADGKPVLKLVPPYRPPDIADLLRHTSGISYEYTASDLIAPAYIAGHIFDEPLDNAAFADRIAKLPLAWQPGTVWRYGHSTDVLGRVIEVASGKSLYAFERERIFVPLGMTNTRYEVSSGTDRLRLAEPLPSDLELLRSEQVRRSHPQWQSGGGGLVSTAADYARFSQMMLQRGELDGKRYLSPSSYAQMTTDQIGPGSGVAHDDDYFPGAAFGFGFGLAIRINAGNPERPDAGAIGDLEWDSGSGPSFLIDPRHDMIAVMMMQVGAKRGRLQHTFKELVYEALEK
jgi:CubicO group peptidase (beta-lactamase class C family)